MLLAAPLACTTIPSMHQTINQYMTTPRYHPQLALASQAHQLFSFAHLSQQLPLAARCLASIPFPSLCKAAPAGCLSITLWSLRRSGQARLLFRQYFAVAAPVQPCPNASIPIPCAHAWHQGSIPIPSFCVPATNPTIPTNLNSILLHQGPICKLSVVRQTAPFCKGSIQGACSSKSD